MGRSLFRSATAVVAAALLVAACGDDDTTAASDDTVAEDPTTSEEPAAAPDEAAPTSTTPSQAAPTTTLVAGADQVIEVTVADGSVDNGGRHDVAVGDTVALVIRSDVADEVHVHGYDVTADVGPGGPVTVLVEATIPGVWEVELHDSRVVLLELAVS